MLLVSQVTNYMYDGNIGLTGCIPNIEPCFVLLIKKTCPKQDTKYNFLENRLVVSLVTLDNKCHSSWLSMKVSKFCLLDPSTASIVDTEPRSHISSVV